MLLSRRQFFVKERVAFVKLVDTYDIFDAETQQQIGIAKEEPSSWSHFARLLVNKMLLPTTVNIYEDESSPPVLRLTKKVSIFRPDVIVSDRDGRELGRFRAKSFTIGGGFHVYDPSGQHVAEVKGDWKGWNFRVIDDQGQELGVVTKKWSGLGKELFTSADNYMISLSDLNGKVATTAGLLLAAGIAIDVIFKEGK